jgi:hypothetical protein
VVVQPGLIADGAFGVRDGFASEKTAGVSCPDLSPAPARPLVDAIADGPPGGLEVAPSSGNTDHHDERCL